MSVRRQPLPNLTNLGNPAQLAYVHQKEAGEHGRRPLPPVLGAKPAVTAADGSTLDDLALEVVLLKAGGKRPWQAR